MFPGAPKRSEMDGVDWEVYLGRKILMRCGEGVLELWDVITAEQTQTVGISEQRMMGRLRPGYTSWWGLLRVTNF